jgi:hypothetical protein
MAISIKRRLAQLRYPAQRNSNSLQLVRAAMMPVPEDPDTLLTRAKLAERLTERGFPVKAKTLSTKASRGGGPAYQLFGRKPLYRWGDALDWATKRLSKPVRSTSEIETTGLFVQRSNGHRGT